MAPLPPKQQGVFKKILKCYDHKNYKMGLKLTKLILGNPETAGHGETLAMKGLIYNCMGRKDEAYQLVRTGLMKDLTSHVCWHVYGLLLRSEHKYEEAIKCYRNALKYDEKNITILRDLSLLQVQMRDLEGFRDTRYQLFMLRSAQRVSWINFAVAYHLLNDYETAARILDEFKKTQKKQKEQNGQSQKESDAIEYDESELILYQLMILHEAGNHKKAYDFLIKHSSQICDRLAVLEYKADLLLALGRNAEASKLIQDHLIARNQDNLHYYQLLESALNINPQDESARLELYMRLQAIYPRSQVLFKIPLNFVRTPEKFRPLVDIYLKKSIRKGLPSLFRILKPIYNYECDRLISEINTSIRTKKNPPLDSKENYVNSLGLIETGSNPREERKIRAGVLRNHSSPEKVSIIQELILSYENNLKNNNSFDDDSSSKNSEDKTIVLWVYYFLAQHFDYLGDYDRALNYVKIAMDHTPTLIELLTLKGKIYKHLGEFDKAAEQVNEAQRWDTADRYLNSKCAKYLLRANKILQAEDMCSKFTRVNTSVVENLNEMQCMWFHIEVANAHYRLGKYGDALKKCYEIDNFFSDVIEDQFDFHTYCLRKATLRSYVKLLRMEDVIRRHKFYFDAAQLAINIYLKLYDEPLKTVKDNKGGNSNKLSDAELKKIKSKERKAAAKQNQSTNKQVNKNKSHSEDASDNSAQKVESKDSLDPMELEHPKNPLEKAIRFLTPLKTLAKQRIDTHLLAFEVYKRNNKVLLMLQSVKRAIELDPLNSKLSKQLVEFNKIAESRVKDEKINAHIREVLKIELPKLKSHTSIE